MRDLIEKSFDALNAVRDWVSGPQSPTATLLTSESAAERAIGARRVRREPTSDGIHTLISLVRDDSSSRVRNVAEKVLLSIARKSSGLCALVATSVVDAALSDGSRERDDIELMIAASNRMGRCLRSCDMPPQMIDSIVGRMFSYFDGRQCMAEELASAREARMPCGDPDFFTDDRDDDDALIAEAADRNSAFSRMLDACEVLGVQQMYTVRAMAGVPGALAERCKCIHAEQIEPTDDGWTMLEHLKVDLASSPKLAHTLLQLDTLWRRRLENGNPDYSATCIRRLSDYLQQHIPVYQYGGKLFWAERHVIGR